MDATMQNTRKLTFHTLGQQPLTGTVRNPNATLGQVAAKAAAELQVAGAYECLNKADEKQMLSPDTRLVDLPDAITDITLSPDLTPAERGRHGSAEPRRRRSTHAG